MSSPPFQDAPSSITHPCINSPCHPRTAAWGNFHKCSVVAIRHARFTLNPSPSHCKLERLQLTFVLWLMFSCIYSTLSLSSRCSTVMRRVVRISWPIWPSPLCKWLSTAPGAPYKPAMTRFVCESVYICMWREGECHTCYMVCCMLPT